MRTGGHPDRSWDVQDTYLHGMINVSWLEVSLYWFWVLTCSRKVSWVVGGGWHSENNISSWSRSSDFELEKIGMT